MEKTEKERFKFGLVGRSISYSFSRGYFGEKFKNLKLTGHSYENFDLDTIEEFSELLTSTSHLKGLNVTIPYKEEVIHYLDAIDESAKEIGAVNTIKITNKVLKGYNTDTYGFQMSLQPFLKSYHKKALILGTGGASKAVAYVLKKLQIEFKFVSRSVKNNGLTYDNLNNDIIKAHTLIINCSPVGTYPDIDKKPKIPYSGISKKHLLYDLIYNPEKTAFLRAGEKHGAETCNGLRMLELQAEKAWEIWNEEPY